LRQQLVALGHRFSTNGDSEVIVHCYERFGPRAWEMPNGQFAFALWDSRLRKLWLVRDRLGILPLHYACVSDQRLTLILGAQARIIAGGEEHPHDIPSGAVPAHYLRGNQLG
jgi:asparagine synthase (glutamine-hydrolysing)